MEKKQPSPAQVFAITEAEYLISIFYTDPEETYSRITKIIDEHNIIEHGEIMNYFYESLVSKGYLEHADALLKKYKIQIEKN